MAAASFCSCRGGGAGGSGAGGSGCTNWMLFDSILMLYNGVLLVLTEFCVAKCNSIIINGKILISLIS